MNMDEELRNLKGENDVWKFINKYRKRREKITNNITEEEWRKYFMGLLEGSEIKILGEKRMTETVMKEEKL